MVKKDKMERNTMLHQNKKGENKDKYLFFCKFFCKKALQKEEENKSKNRWNGSTDHFL